MFPPVLACCIPVQSQFRIHCAGALSARVRQFSVHEERRTCQDRLFFPLIPGKKRLRQVRRCLRPPPCLSKAPCYDPTRRFNHRRFPMRALGLFAVTIAFSGSLWSANLGVAQTATANSSSGRNFASASVSVSGVTGTGFTSSASASVKSASGTADARASFTSGNPTGTATASATGNGRAAARAPGARAKAGY